MVITVDYYVTNFSDQAWSVLHQAWQTPLFAVIAVPDEGASLV
jgi:hypothetical protein